MAPPNYDVTSNYTTASQLAALSKWIDNAPTNTARTPDELLWIRVGKVTAEAGEVMDALSGVSGENPRKGVTHTREDVRRELLDAATAALCAWEHMSGNCGGSLQALKNHVAQVYTRADIGPEPELFGPMVNNLCGRNTCYICMDPYSSHMHQ